MMWNDDYYHQVEKQFGADVMSRVADSHRTAIDFVENVRTLTLFNMPYSGCRAFMKIFLVFLLGNSR